ncbi:MAG: polyprenyl synthetase family protein [Holophagales bacterium]|nr:polyprenyl synthetase family protein [Holophagales bacterium]
MTVLTDRPAGPLSRSTAVEDEVLGRLRDLCEVGGLPDLAATIDDLVGFVRDDLAAVEEGLATLSTGDTLVGEAGTSLVHLGGKRLRPLCVVLASRVGSAQASAVRDIAVAAELVHNATLLHDDVIDHADQRRGRPTARLELGNAASIFAGDYLLIEALHRVQRAAVPGVMEGLLGTIAEMIRAESLQLENRGSLDASEDLYFEVARGKSAALFSWALGAGALSGGASPELCRALRAYGESIGVAFQLIDDLLDLVGHHSNTGKTLFSDLSEGKITYPLIVVLDREPALIETIRAIAAEAASSWGGDGVAVPGSNGDGSGNGHPGGANGAGRERERVLEAMVRHNVEATCRDLAASYIDKGIEALAEVPDSPARSALTVVARASVLRER